MASLIMDGVVALLLVATIWFAVRLNSRLVMLRADGERLERLIAGLSAASHHAEEAVSDLRETAGLAGRQLQSAIDKAGPLLADLQFMTDKANSIADKLDESLRAQRSAAPRAPGQDAEARAADVAAAALLGTPPRPESKSRRPDPVGARVPAEDDQADKQVQNRLAALLKQAEASTRSARTKVAPAPPAVSPPATPTNSDDGAEGARPIALQSRAEREFLKAMEGRK